MQVVDTEQRLVGHGSSVGNVAVEFLLRP
jgi:hypothetical protein